METVQFKKVSGIIFSLLISALVLLAVFTWHLSQELNTLQANVTQPATTLASNTSSTASSPDAAALLSGTSAPSAARAQSQQEGQGSVQNTPQNVNPFNGFSDPLDNPWRNDWPGFMMPGSGYTEMQKRMDELMNSMTRGFPFFNQNDFGFGFMAGGPAISMTEDSQAYLVTIQIPEGQNVELETEISNKTLIISGSVKSEQEEAGVAGFNSRSMQESRFSQSMYLSEDIDEEAMAIERNDEEIVISIPKLQ